MRRSASEVERRSDLRDRHLQATQPPDHLRRFTLDGGRITSMIVIHNH